MIAATVNRAKPSSEELEEIFRGHIAENTMVLTDGLHSYHILETIAKCTVVDVNQEGGRGLFNLNTDNSLHSYIKETYNHYCGVATKYINRYNALFSIAFRCADNLKDTFNNFLLNKSWLPTFFSKHSTLRTVLRGCWDFLVYDFGIFKRCMEINFHTFTEFQVEVVKALKGADEGDAFRVLQTGISTDTMIFEIEDDPLLVIGDEYLIFGEYNNLGTVTILGGPQGRYIYEDDMISSLTSSDGYPILSLAEKVNTDSNISFQKINANILFDEVEKCIAE